MGGKLVKEQPRGRFAKLAEEQGGLTEVVRSLQEDGPTQLMAAQPGSDNHLDTSVRIAVVDEALARPGVGAVAVANKLKNQGIAVSPGAVREVFSRYSLDKRQDRVAASRRTEERSAATPAEAQRLARLTLWHLIAGFATGMGCAAAFLHLY